MEHGVLHGGQHAADPRRSPRPGARVESRRAAHRAARRVLLPVHALGGDGRSRVALAARSRRGPVQLLPARARRAGALVAGGSGDRHVGDHRHHRVVGDRLLPRDLPGGIAGHPARAVRGGGPRRRRRLAHVPVDHAPAAPSGAPVRRGHPCHRVVPDLRPGLRAHQRRAGRRHANRRAASLRDGVPELLPVRRRLRHGLGAVRDHHGLLDPPVPAPARTHGVLRVRRPRVQALVLTLALSVLAIVWLLPIVWVFVTSLKLTADIVRLPPEWVPWPVTAEHYQEVLFSSSRTARIGRAFANSLVIALGTVALVVVTSAMAAYPLARLRFPGRDVVFTLLVGSLMIPNAVVLVPLRSAYSSESYGPIMAGAALSALPLLVVFIVANQRIVEGVRVSGLKG